MSIETVIAPAGDKPWQFQKGKSGNPGGRPRLEHDVKEMARQASPEIMQRLIDMALGRVECKAEIAVRAAEVVLSRAFGLPRQAIDVNKVEQQFVAILPLPAESAEAWAAKAAQINGRTIEHHEFEPAPVEPIPCVGSSEP